MMLTMHTVDRKFDQLYHECAMAGLFLMRMSFTHWQITGGKCVVNYYPDTKRGDRMYVNGTAGGVAATFDKAIQAAEGLVNVTARHERKKPGKKSKRMRVKRALHKKQKGRCALCGDELSLKEATFDHKIPLSKGGSRGQDNLQLAHRRCNGNKSNAWPF